MLDLKKIRKKRKERENISFALRVSVVYYFTSEDKYLWQFHLLFYVVLLNITVRESIKNHRG